ncbi:MRG-domain-containing protein [Cladochytrium replicatum]|nr:MRG-domain-containing protein [Cladochytrium replicatum]
MSGSDKLFFEENERVLCFHGPLLYEAKVQKAEYFTNKEDPNENGPHYFVHYKGWKQTWDEWVPESRVLKFSDENLKRQSELKDSMSTKKQRTKEKVAHDSGTDRGRKRQREMAEKEEEFLKRPEIKLSLPEGLKILLVDDWENVTKNQKLVGLPREPNVDTILDRYLDNMKKKGSRESRADDILNEVVEGLKLYFNRALGNTLLYRFERTQYANIRKRFPDKEMSEVYGAEHLLRLFVHLPQFIAHTNMDQDAINILKDNFVDFLKYLDANSKSLFLTDYENASPAYLQNSKVN